MIGNKIKTLDRIIVVVCLALGFAVGSLIVSSLGGCSKEDPPCAWLAPGEYRIKGVLSVGPREYCGPTADFVAELDEHGLQPTDGTDCTTTRQADDNACNVTATTECPNGFYMAYMLSIRNPGISGGRIEVGYRGTPAVCYYAVTYEPVQQADGGAGQGD